MTLVTKTQLRGAMSAHWWMCFSVQSQFEQASCVLNTMVGHYVMQLEQLCLRTLDFRIWAFWIASVLTKPFLLKNLQFSAVSGPPTLMRVTHIDESNHLVTLRE